MPKASMPPRPAQFFIIYLTAVSKTSPGEDTLGRVDVAVRNLQNIGAQAAKGFDFALVEYHLGAIAITARPGRWRGHSGGVGILDFGIQAHERFTIREIRNLREQVSAVVEGVKRLNRTPLLALLRVTGKISTESVFAATEVDPDEAFSPLLGIHPSLPEDPGLLQLADDLAEVERFARDYSKGRQALIDVHLRRLIRYILQTTGRAHDRIIVDLLSPLRIMHCGSTDELKRWRNSVGLRQ
jgi:hypothetical protein